MTPRARLISCPRYMFVRAFEHTDLARFFIAFFVSLLFTASAQVDIRADVRAIFASDADTFDFTQAKLAADSMIDPFIDMDAQLAEIDRMVAEIEAMLPADADSWAKVQAMRQYIYLPGPWNGGKAFSYDHDDPYGLDVRNKLLSDYLQDRRGNCVTMPVLFIILGQRLGLDVTPAMAPLHVLVKFTDDDGKVWNLEATSGAGAARDQHYRDLLPITDEAVANGVFLSPLSEEESISLIAAVVAEDLIEKGRYQDAMAVADTLIEHYPMFAYMMVMKATAAYHLLQQDFYAK